MELTQFHHESNNSEYSYQQNPTKPYLSIIPDFISTISFNSSTNHFPQNKLRILIIDDCPSFLLACKFITGKAFLDYFAARPYLFVIVFKCEDQKISQNASFELKKGYKFKRPLILSLETENLSKIFYKNYGTNENFIEIIYEYSEESQKVTDLKSLINSLENGYCGSYSGIFEEITINKSKNAKIIEENSAEQLINIFGEQTDLLGIRFLHLFDPTLKPDIFHILNILELDYDGMKLDGFCAVIDLGFDVVGGSFDLSDDADDDLADPTDTLKLLNDNQLEIIKPAKDDPESAILNLQSKNSSSKLQDNADQLRSKKANSSDQINTPTSSKPIPIITYRPISNPDLNIIRDTSKSNLLSKSQLNFNNISSLDPAFRMRSAGVDSLSSFGSLGPGPVKKLKSSSTNFLKQGFRCLKTSSGTYLECNEQKDLKKMQQQIGRNEEFENCSRDSLRFAQVDDDRDNDSQANNFQDNCFSPKSRTNLKSISDASLRSVITDNFSSQVKPKSALISTRHNKSNSADNCRYNLTDCFANKRHFEDNLKPGMSQSLSKSAHELLFPTTFIQKSSLSVEELCLIDGLNFFAEASSYASPKNDLIAVKEFDRNYNEDFKDSVSNPVDLILDLSGDKIKDVKLDQNVHEKPINTFSVMEMEGKNSEPYSDPLISDSVENRKTNLEITKNLQDFLIVDVNSELNLDHMSKLTPDISDLLDQDPLNPSDPIDMMDTIDKLLLELPENFDFNPLANIQPKPVIIRNIIPILRFLLDLKFKNDDNLLMLAIRCCNIQVTQILINCGINVNSTNHNHEIAADIASQKGQFEILLMLLHANSRFPHNFKMSSEAPVKLRNFIKVMDVLHEMICKVIEAHDENLGEAEESFVKITEKMQENFLKIRELVNKMPHLDYWFNTSNQSAVTTAILNKKFSTYNFLLSIGLFMGIYEKLDEIKESLNEDEKELITEVNAYSAQPLPKDYILILKLNSFVWHSRKNEESHSELITEALQVLDENEVTQPLLEIVAAAKDFRIIFDFNRSSIEAIDFTAKSSTSAIFYVQRHHIYIGAKDMLNNDKKYQAFGTFAHELCHFAMQLTYNNSCRPYREGSKRKLAFEKINAVCMELMYHENLVAMVYNYPDFFHHAELIVRIPHMTIYYTNDKPKLQSLQNTYNQLDKYYKNEVLEDIKKKIPNVTENFYTNLKFEHAFWKKKAKKEKLIKYLLVFLVIIGLTLVSALLWILSGYDRCINSDRNCTWNDLLPKTQQSILETNVNFQGNIVKLEALIGSNEAAKLDLTNEQIRNPRHIIINYQNLNLNFEYFDRKFTNYNETYSYRAGNCRFFYLSKNTYTLDGLRRNESRKLFVLSDEPVAGKTTTLKYIANDLRTKESHKWVSYIDLKAMKPEIFEKYKKIEEFDGHDFLNFLVDCHENKLEGTYLEIFKDKLENGEVALFVDHIETVFMKNAEFGMKILENLEKIYEDSSQDDQNLKLSKETLYFESSGQVTKSDLKDKTQYLMLSNGLTTSMPPIDSHPSKTSIRTAKIQSLDSRTPIKSSKTRTSQNTIELWLGMRQTSGLIAQQIFKNQTPFHIKLLPLYCDYKINFVSHKLASMNLKTEDNLKALTKVANFLNRTEKWRNLSYYSFDNIYLLDIIVADAAKSVDISEFSISLFKTIEKMFKNILDFQDGDQIEEQKVESSVVGRKNIITKIAIKMLQIKHEELNSVDINALLNEMNHDPFFSNPDPPLELSDPFISNEISAGIINIKNNKLEFIHKIYFEYFVTSYLKTEFWDRIDILSYKTAMFENQLKLLFKIFEDPSRKFVMIQDFLYDFVESEARVGKFKVFKEDFRVEFKEIYEKFEKDVKIKGFKEKLSKMFEIDKILKNYLLGKS